MQGLMLSELLEIGREILAKEGDRLVVVGDMVPLTAEDVQVVSDQLRAKKFLHLGEW